ncbi:PhoH family protein [Acholeplasma sp. OttesenSCG-928-E16]|nr:PhoH family protein [Acholeplasma sp. OttesenSCG-928-E16]
MKLNLEIKNTNTLANIVGINDNNLKIFKDYLGITVSIRETNIITDAKGEDKELLELIFKYLIKLGDSGISFSERDVIYLTKLAKMEKLDDSIIDLYKSRTKIIINDKGKAIYPKTFNQKAYVDAIYNNNLVFGIGPAGTGKTYLAVALAVAAFKNNKVKKVILTRPAVEAGESLGFLPGDLKEKIDPYLIPLYDALEEFLGKQTMQSHIEKGIIEIAPLAYMRGRTLENAFVILDEAQNATRSQMKMFLTRLGFSSKMVVTGDPSQTDLSRKDLHSLSEIPKILSNLDDVKIIEFDKMDVIRHPLVQRVLERYDEYENKRS